jgi:hypothetical protein
MKLQLLLVSIALSQLACVAPDDLSAASDANDDAPDSAGDGPYEGVDGVFARACERLHGECASVCDNVFVECYDDIATCTEQWKLDYLADYDAPIVDDDLVERCAADVDQQSCTDLRPDTPACEYAIVEGCVGDDDAHGAIYSPFTPGAARVGEVIEVELCEWVVEYFAIELEAGAVLETLGADDGPVPGFIERVELLETTEGDAVIESANLGTPVAHAGTYLLAVESATAGSFRFSIVPAQ